MEFQIRTPELGKALARVQGIVEKKTTMPILANVLIKSKGKDAITVSATDLEIGHTADYEAKVIKGGALTVDARALHSIVKALPEATVTIKQEANAWIVVASGKSRYRIVGMAAESFPTLPKLDDVPFFAVDPVMLRSALDRVLHAVSTDETRYNLTGVAVTHLPGGNIRLCATDGHRLALYERDIPGAVIPDGVIIPRKAIVEIKRMLDAGGDEARLGFVSTSIVFERGGVVLTARRVDGKFPDVEQVIPTSAKLTATFDRAALLAAIKRVALLVPDKGQGISVTLPTSEGEGEATLRSNNPDVGEAIEEVAVTLGMNGGKPGLVIGLNAAYLIDALGSLPEEKVSIDLIDELSPAVLRGATPDQKAVVMPMRVG